MAQPSDQFIDVDVERAMANVETIATHQSLEVTGKLIRAGNLGTIEQDRYHGNAACQRRRDLDAHEVVVIFEPAAAVFGARIHPIRADDRQQHVALANLPGQ